MGQQEVSDTDLENAVEIVKSNPMTKHWIESSTVARDITNEGLALIKQRASDAGFEIDLSTIEAQLKEKAELKVEKIQGSCILSVRPMVRIYSPIVKVFVSLRARASEHFLSKSAHRVTFCQSCIDDMVRQMTESVFTEFWAIVNPIGISILKALANGDAVETRLAESIETLTSKRIGSVIAPDSVFRSIGFSKIMSPTQQESYLNGELILNKLLTATVSLLKALAADSRWGCAAPSCKAFLATLGEDSFSLTSSQTRTASSPAFQRPKLSNRGRSS